MTDSRALAIKALFMAGGAAGILGSTPVLAEANEGVVVAEVSQDATNLGTIDVHGRKVRREPTGPEFVAPLVDTPRAVTVIPQQVIEQTGAMSLQDVLANSPGITLGAGEGGQPLADRPIIRGQASGNNIFVDGLRDSGGQQREVFNLEQVEVVKGPDAVYSGRGSGGGSINLATKQPRLNNFTHVSLGAGTDAYLRGTIDTNYRISDNAALRLNIMGAQGDVAGRDSVDYDKWGLSAAFAAGLGTDTTFTVGYYHLTSNQMPDYGLPLFTKTGVRDDESGVLNVPRDAFYGVKDRDYLENKVDTFAAIFQHDFSDNLRIRNVTRYSETLNDYVVTNPGDGGNVTNGGVANVGGVWWMKRGTKSRWNPTRTVANVTDLTGSFEHGNITHNFNAGVELSREKNRNASYVITTTGGSTCPAPLTGYDCTPLYAPNTSDSWQGTIERSLVSRNSTDTLAVYAFDSINIGEKLILNLGVRYDDYSVDGVHASGTLTAPVYTVNGGDWSFTNYQVGVVYKPTQNSSVYASWATSSAPPTISAGDQNTTGVGSGNLAGTLLEPEDTESFEIGAKATLFDDRLALGVAAFQLTRENAQILVAPNIYEQAGEVEVKGVELSASGNITDKWQVFGGYTWQDSELVKGAYNSTVIGEQLANTPEHSVSLFTTYRLLPKLTVGGGVYYVSKSWGGNQNGAGGGTNRVYAPEYTRVDLMGTYDINDTASLTLNVKNVGDERYIMRTNGVHHADVAPGRSAMLTLNLRY